MQRMQRTTTATILGASFVLLGCAEDATLLGEPNEGLQARAERPGRGVRSEPRDPQNYIPGQRTGSR